MSLLDHVFTVHCFFQCGHAVRNEEPKDAHAEMEEHYRMAHRHDLDRLGHGSAFEGKLPFCTLCGDRAVMWSGAWVVGGCWIGWCSKSCQNAWLRGKRSNVAGGDEERFAYIDVAPCGCTFAAMIDNPERHKEVARFCADVIKDGLHVERVTVAEARYRLMKSPHGTGCKTPPIAVQPRLTDAADLGTGSGEALSRESASPLTSPSGELGAERLPLPASGSTVSRGDGA